jgi:hypothetical protein
VSPVRYELGFHITEDGILHSHRRENLKSHRKKCVGMKTADVIRSANVFNTIQSSGDSNGFSYILNEISTLSGVNSSLDQMSVRTMRELITVNHFDLKLWSSGQRSWLQTLRSRVRLPALTDFPSSSGSGTGSTQPREDN